MSWKLWVAGVSLALVVIALADPASALNEVANGKVLAKQWCASCHLVAPDQIKASVDAPPFASIAKRSNEELDRLLSFLADPHPKMPNFNLTRQEITDLVAYIRSLKK